MSKADQSEEADERSDRTSIAGKGAPEDGGDSSEAETLAADSDSFTDLSAKFGNDTRLEPIDSADQPTITLGTPSSQRSLPGHSMSAPSMSLGESQVSRTRADPIVYDGDKGEDPLIGRLIGERYRLRKALARGGFGRVYLADHELLGRKVAVKVLDPRYSGETLDIEDFRKRFILEASICAKLKHPNSVTIFDYGVEDDIYFIVMEYLEGSHLRRALRRAENKVLDLPRALHITMQIAKALSEAHELGVVHRDLKPPNIFLVERDGDPDFVKVLDFGLVKDLDNAAEQLTKTGLFMGSPKYMAPEQIRQDADGDHRIDIYALGILLFELLTGRVPFVAENDIDVLMGHMNSPIPTMEEVNPNVEVPEAIEAIVYKALAKSPENRFASMAEFRAALVLAAPELLANEAAASTLQSMQLSISSLIEERNRQRAELQNVGKSSRLRAVAGLVAALAIGGAAVFALSPSEPKQETRVERVVVEKEVPVVQEKPAAPTPAEVSVHTRPPGAKVFHKGNLLGETPLTANLGIVEPESLLEFKVEKEGFRPLSFERAYYGKDMHIEVSLIKDVKAAESARVRIQRVKKPKDDLNFRDSPY